MNEIGAVTVGDPDRAVTGGVDLDGGRAIRLLVVDRERRSRQLGDSVAVEVEGDNPAVVPRQHRVVDARAVAGEGDRRVGDPELLGAGGPDDRQPVSLAEVARPFGDDLAVAIEEPEGVSARAEADDPLIAGDGKVVVSPGVLAVGPGIGSPGFVPANQAATIPCGSITYFRAAPWSKAS